MQTRANTFKEDNQSISTYEYIWECQISDEHVGNGLHGLITTNNDYKGERERDEDEPIERRMLDGESTYEQQAHCQ